MSRVLTIALTGMRQYARDRSALFFTLLLPVLIIVVIGLSIGGTTEVPVGVAVEDDSSLAADLGRRLRRLDGIAVRSYDDTRTLRRDVRRGSVVAGVVVPSGYDAALRGGGATVTMLLGADAGAIATRPVIAGAVSAQAAEVLAARSTPGDLDANLAVARTVTGQARVVDVERTSLGGDPLPSGFSYTAPSNLVLFVFLSSLASATVIVASRRLGVARRMLATPTSARAIVTGFALGRFVFALLQGLFVFAVGALVFGVDWGDPAAAAALLVAFALVAMSAAMLMGTLATTEEQAGSIGPPLGIALGMLGGCMWPLEVVPEFMRDLGHAFPHAWAMDAWIELIGQDAGFADIAPNLLALLAFVALLFPLATWRLRRSITAGGG